MQRAAPLQASLREDTSEVPFYDSFIRPAELISGVAASDKQTRGSKLIKNGEVNSAPSEEMEFSQMGGFALKTSRSPPPPRLNCLQKVIFKVSQPHTNRLYCDYYSCYLSHEGFRIIFIQFSLRHLQL